MIHLQKKNVQLGALEGGGPQHITSKKVLLLQYHITNQVMIKYSAPAGPLHPPAIGGMKGRGGMGRRQCCVAPALSGGHADRGNMISFPPTLPW